MKIEERMQQVEENFNQLKNTYEEKQKQIEGLQQEVLDLEKSMIFTKGAYQMLVELKEAETPVQPSDEIAQAE